MVRFARSDLKLYLFVCRHDLTILPSLILNWQSSCLFYLEIIGTHHYTLQPGAFKIQVRALRTWITGAEEMAQLSRALAAAAAEDLGLGSGTHSSQLTITPVPGYPTSFSDSPGHRIHVVHKHMQEKHSYTKNKQLKNVKELRSLFCCWCS